MSRRVRFSPLRAGVLGALLAASHLGHSAELRFPAHTITTAADGAISVFAADVDGDGDTDVLSASFSDNKIAWYENDGSENFTTHTITTAASPRSSEVCDMGWKKYLKSPMFMGSFLIEP